jgi:hypothetical protein
VLGKSSGIRFSERVVAAAFGRYQAGEEVEPPANKVLVGREGQRAFFIDLLLRIGRRGAFLVTGRRGVGKTIFVNHCLTEYRREVYKRFLHSNVGRVTFWDRIGVLLLGLIAILCALVVSEITEILTLPVPRSANSPHTNILIWLVVAPLILVCLYPLLFAREVCEEILEACRANRIHRLDAAPATVLTLLVTWAAWELGPFGAPAVSMSRLFLAICLLYLWVQATSFNCRHDLEKSEAPWLLRYWKLTTGFVVAFLILGVFFARGDRLPWLQPLTANQEFESDILWALSMLGTGIFLRGSHLLRTFKQPEEKSFAEEASRAPWRWLQWCQAPQVWYLCFGFLIIISSNCFLFNERLFWTLTSSGTFMLAGLTVFFTLSSGFSMKKERPRSANFHPQPLLILAGKAVICVVVTLQLIHPVLSKCTWPRLAVTPDKSPIISSALRPPIALREISGLWLKYPVVKEEVSSRQQEGSQPEQTTVTEGSAVFHGRDEELRWVIALFLALLTVYFVEYEWVIRPFVPEREDASINPAGFHPEWRDQPSNLRRPYADLAQLTLPWLLYKAWLPVLQISVNLGFEKLDHRRVVHAMLAGLRAQYNRAFLAWNSSLANLGRWLGLLLLMLLATLTGDRWFNLPQPQTQGDREWVRDSAAHDYRDLCKGFEARQRGPGAVNIICKVRWGEQMFHILYYNILQFHAVKNYNDQESHLLFYVFPYRQEPWPAKADRMDKNGNVLPPLLEEGINFRIYDLVLMLFFFVVGRWLLHRIPAIPYQEILNRIDEVMDNLAARTSVTSTTGRWKPAQWLQGFFVDERVRQTEQEPVDPRTIEFVFLQILWDIQTSALHLPGGRTQLISLPTPEIIFVFDELDKLGTRVEPDEGSSGGGQQAEILHAERRRSMELHKLLADMKNLLSSAPARFIFVGGRNLHDEWLADQTARQPLLTNIFNAEVYLPALLTDHGNSQSRRLHLRIEAYLRHQLVRARVVYSRSLKKRWLSSLGLPLHIYATDTFLLDDGRASATEASEECGASLTNELPIVDLGGGAPQFIGADEFRRDLIQFLTYRSMGSPKRLKELLGTFVRPVGRVITDSTEHREAFEFCDHVLHFGDNERFRIQLLARIYRHLAMTFEQGLVRRDDKLAVSVFYLTDFLFKFHRRAFSWSNLERVDELVHIHRAPDLREVLEAIVVQWSERFLHRIRNGMYDFRFRSDLAREIEYISRQSHEEMAAFNFTLDESQALKSVYETDINRFKGENSREIQDLLAGLGELHEFDQEYETARFYYRRAISSLDTELSELTGGSKLLETSSAAIEILGARPAGRENVRLFMTWGIARLRLMLQVGMTFELSRNHERAEVEYRNASTLARSLLLAMLDHEGRESALDLGLLDENPDDADRIHALKHLNLIYQPVFAEAWVAEKLSGGVDTSIAQVEKELWQLRTLLPFVREARVVLSTDSAEVKGSNFALIVSELHNKAGDLYFFKGRQAVPLKRGKEVQAVLAGGGGVGGPRRGQEGYLLRAHYHYAVGLHELRRFATHRRFSSKYKFNIWSEKVYSPLWETIEPGGWSDFIYRSAGGTLGDCAEVMLGRVSLFSLFQEISALEGAVSERVQRVPDIPEMIHAFVRGCTEWFERAPCVDEGTGAVPEEAESEAIERADTQVTPNLDARSKEDQGFKIEIDLGSRVLKAGTLGGWLGVWNVAPRRPSVASWKLLLFEEGSSHSDVTRLPVALNLTLVGAKYLEMGGYIEDAAREHLKVCETVTYYLWWALGFKRLTEWKYDLKETLELTQALGMPALAKSSEEPSTAGVEAYWSYLLRVALFALCEADELFRRSRREEEVLPAAYRIGDKIPTAALTLACSLGLSAPSWDEWNSLKDKMKSLLKYWTGNDKFELSSSSLREVLIASLVRHSYPMINRLHGLRVLINDSILSERGDSLGQIVDWTHELLDLSGNLNAPLHFTPFHSGVTCALVYLKYRTDDNASLLERIRAAASRELSDSEEMYTLRRAFYENIADLYYLYDDFNDRQIHYNHAMQMAGAEFASLLRFLVKTYPPMSSEKPPQAEPMSASAQ